MKKFRDMTDSEKLNIHAFEDWWDRKRLESWSYNPHPAWRNNKTKENMPDDWMAAYKPTAFEAWEAAINHMNNKQ